MPAKPPTYSPDRPEDHFGLVAGIARRYLDRTELEMEDLVQEGMLGVMRAAEKFESDRGFQFSTYATPWVHAFIRNAIVANHNLVRVKRGGASGDVYSKIVKASEALDPDLVGVAREEALAAKIGVTLKNLRLAMPLFRGMTSWDWPVGGDDDATFGDFQPGPDVEAEIEQADGQAAFVRAVEFLLEGLAARERDVVVRRCGDGECLRSIAADHGVSREWVRRITNNALDLMRVRLGRAPNRERELRLLLTGVGVNEDDNEEDVMDTGKKRTKTTTSAGVDVLSEEDAKLADDFREAIDGMSDAKAVKLTGLSWGTIQLFRKGEARRMRRATRQRIKEFLAKGSAKAATKAAGEAAPKALSNPAPKPMAAKAPAAGARPPLDTLKGPTRVQRGATVSPTPTKTPPRPPKPAAAKPLVAEAKPLVAEARPAPKAPAPPETSKAPAPPETLTPSAPKVESPPEAEPVAPAAPAAPAAPSSAKYRYFMDASWFNGGAKACEQQLRFETTERLDPDGAAVMASIVRATITQLHGDMGAVRVALTRVEKNEVLWTA